MLTSIAPDLWSFDYQVDMGPLTLPARTCVLRFPRGLMLISPGPLGEPVCAALSELGEVSALVAPNLYHNIHLPAAMAQFPQASVYAPAGIEKRNQKIAPTGFSNLAELNEGWTGLRAIPIEGVPKLAETAFYHEPSKSLLVTDLAFNIENPKGFGMWVMFNLFGTYKRFYRSRLINLLTKDKAALRRSLERLLELDFERVVMAHGSVVEERAKERFRVALALR